MKFLIKKLSFSNKFLALLTSSDIKSQLVHQWMFITSTQGLFLTFVQTLRLHSASRKQETSSVIRKYIHANNFFSEQECIPLGCVPPAAVAVSAPWGAPAAGGCLLQGGACSGGGIPACTEADTPREQND